jgi:hypothetical protein
VIFQITAHARFPYVQKSSEQTRQNGLHEERTK